MRTIKAGFLGLLISVTGFTTAEAASVKAMPEAAKGCIPTVSLPRANAAIERFNLSHVNASREEIQALGTGLVWIEQLNGGETPEIAIANDGYSFRFVSEMGASQQLANSIMIRRNGAKKNGENVAQLVHELGHLIGNRGMYGEYRAAMKGTMCVVSGYSDDKANEQFAEVFAAFVTVPGHMRSIESVGCKRAYAFFSQNVFKNGALATKCATDSLEAGVDY